MRISLPIFLIVAIAVAFGGGYFVFTMQNKQQQAGIFQPSLDGIIQTQGKYGGNFSLTDHTGSPVDQNSLVGKYHLVYFGYTYCPDVCPTSLVQMVNAYSYLPDDQQQKVQPLFISVDPKRDTVDQIASYVKDFHPKLAGFTGSEAQIEQIKKNYKVYARIQNDPERIADNSYLVNHSSFYYLIDDKGNFSQLFSDSTDPEILAQYIQQSIKG